MSYKILYLSYDGLTDFLGQSQILPYLCGLSQKGFQITVISAEKPTSFTQRQALIQEIVDEHRIRWVPIRYTKSPPVLSTLSDVLKMKQVARQLYHKESFDIVHCRSYITALVGLHLKRKKGVKFVFDMRGFWADERVEGGLWALKNQIFKLIYQYFKRMEKAFLREADFTISLTENAKTEMLSWPALADTRIQVIPCCVDTELFQKRSFGTYELTREALGIEQEALLLAYLGGIGTWYMLDEMLDFFGCLLKKNPKAHFLFITSEAPDFIVSSAQQKNIPVSAITVRKAERKEVPVFLSLVDISLFFIRPTYSKKASSPTKQGELMSMGIPVICNAGVGDTDWVIKTYQSGILVEQFTHEAYAGAIQQINNLLALDKVPIRRGAEEFYSLQKGIESYQFVYDQLMQ
ncbi:MAG: glycosyltransferase [Bacteroidota bacterium]